MVKDKRVILSTGGTGGHIFPAISLYESLLESGYEPYLLVDKRFINYIKYFKNKVHYKVIISDKISGNIFRKILGLFKLSLGLLQSIIFMLRFKPKLAIGFGGYMTFPSIMAAKILNKKIILHEQNSVLGNANKFLMKYAEFVATTFPEVKNLPKNLAVYTGNFARQEFKKKKPTEVPKITDNLNVTIMGGSQGSSVLGKVVAESLIDFSSKIGKSLNICHQVREEDLSKVRDLYSKHKINAAIKPFFDDINKKMEESHIVIARSGATTITDLMSAGRAAILIPIPHSFANHQLLNAEYICDNKAGWLLEQKDLSVADLSKLLIKIFSNTNLLIEYSNNMSRLNKDGESVIMPKIRQIFA